MADNSYAAVHFNETLKSIEETSCVSCVRKRRKRHQARSSIKHPLAKAGGLPNRDAVGSMLVTKSVGFRWMAGTLFRVNDLTDQHLLRDYAEHESEVAFATLVERYVDLVFSAALRMVCDTHAAKDVTQATFVALARNARSLTDRVSLAGWLHCTARNLAVKIIRSEARRRVREQEAVIMNEMLSGNPDAGWKDIAPHLDEALSELSEAERDAVLLRYFKNQDLRTVGATLGISDDAAQKRISRTVERLREFLAKRGVTVGASGLAIVISANAVQAAPVGLVLTISAAALAGTASTASTLIVATTKTLAMTTLQKTLIAATVAVLTGAGIYEARLAAQLREQNQTLRHQQAPLAEQIRQLQYNFADATNRLADLMAENARLKSNPERNELLKLRGEVGLLQAQASQPAKTKSEKSIAELAKSPQMREMMKATAAISLDKVYAKLFADLKLTPEQASSFKKLITDKLLADTTEKAMMLTGRNSPDQIQQLNDQIAAEKANADSQIQQMLGAEGYAAFQAYEKTYTERSAIVGPTEFSDQLTGSAELTADQIEQLVQAMADERQRFKFTVDYSDPRKISGDLAALYSDDNISRFEQEVEQLNQLYQARAQTILTPDQQAAFQKFLSNRLALQKMGLNMSAKMMGALSGKN